MRLPKWFALVSLSAFWGLALIAFAYLAVGVKPANSDQHLATVVACALGLLAAAGWMVQALIMVNTSRKQHSINVLFQIRMNEVYKAHLDSLGAINRGAGQEFLVEDLIANPASNRSLVFLLNFYENIAVAIAYGDLDEAVMRDSMRGQVCSLVRRSRKAISWHREEDERGVPSDACALVYIHLLKLERRWEEYRERAVPKLKAAEVRAYWDERAQHWRRTGEWPMPYNWK